MGQVRWGIMGAGSIAQRFARSLAQVEGACLVALSGRDPERVRAFAECCGFDSEHRYVSVADDGIAAHQRLVDDPDVDAVYVALPHGMHARWSLGLLRAGKAVLCEKPAVLCEAEALRIVRAVRESGSLFIEAMKPRFTPVRERVRTLLASGALGAIKAIDIVHHLDYGECAAAYLFDPVQGGTLYDLGCYGVSWAEDLLAGDIAIESTRTRWVASAGGAPVDIADEVRMRIGGVPVRLDFAGDAPHFEAACRIRCEHGEVEIPLFHRPRAYNVRRARGDMEVVEAPAEVDDLYGEIVHTCDLVRAGAEESPVMPLSAMMRSARIIDAIRATWPAADARRGEPVGDCRS